MIKKVLSSVLLLALTGCAQQQAQGIFGGGRPTTVKCKGEGNVVAGPYAFMAKCGDGFQFEINVQ
jgi:hypothetical protein